MLSVRRIGGGTLFPCVYSFFVTLQFSLGHFFEATRLVDFFLQSE